MLPFDRRRVGATRTPAAWQRGRARARRLFVFAFARRRTLGVTPREMRDRFAPWFEPVGRIAGTAPPGAAWYLLRRTADVS